MSILLRGDVMKEFDKIFQKWSKIHENNHFLGGSTKSKGRSLFSSATLWGEGCCCQFQAGLHFLLRILRGVRVLRPSAAKLWDPAHLWVFLTASLPAYVFYLDSLTG